MNMKLSSEKQYLVLDNQRLVHYLVKKLGITPNSSDYEDFISIGTIGLVKAAITFDTSKSITFATYASRCINNEIFIHCRKANKYVNDISIYKPIRNDGESKELTLENTIECPESNFVEKIVNKEEYINLVSIALNCLRGKHRIAFLYLMGNISYRKIADKLNVSRGYMTNVKEKITQKVKEIASQQVHYKEVFSMAIVGDEYRISFLSKDISKFNKIFATLLQNLTSVEELPDFKVRCNREQIIIQIPAHPESFSFIAQIIQEIDDFSMSFVSNRTTVRADDTDIKSVETADTNEENKFGVMKKTIPEVPVREKNESTSTEVDTVDKMISKSTAERESGVKQVRDYILSMNSFTVKDLKIHFPNLTVAIISNALYLAKSKGLITAISKGKYVVNKT